MSPDEIVQLRKTAFNAFDPQNEKLINQESDEYIEIFTEDSNPITEMREAITFGEPGRCQFFSGSRGSGKTTQLARLSRMLKNDRYTVININALEYFNPSEPIEPGDLLIVLAAALSEAVAPILGTDPSRVGYLSRLWDYLRLTKAQIDALDISAKYGPLEAGFKMQFRTTDSFRAKVRELVATRTDDLKKATDLYFQNIADQLATLQPGRAGFVLILDQFEQIRGTLTNASEVIESLLRLFTHHRDLLPMPGWHIIYTVPPWLNLAYPGSVDIACFLPCIKLWKNTLLGQPRELYPDGWQKLREIIERRAKADNLDTLFGPTDQKGKRPIVEEMIQYSGGHLRDLFAIVSRCILSARQLPVKEEHVKTAVANLAASMALSEADSLILREVLRTRADCRPDRKPETTMEYAILLDGHLILEFRNGKAWFDVHPAIAKDVEIIAKRVEDRKLAAAIAKEQALAARQQSGGSSGSSGYGSSSGSSHGSGSSYSSGSANPLP